MNLLKVNPDWAKLPLFDRKGWQRVRFGDVVENANETCDPTDAGITRFIAMEHLEPGSLHVRSWGDVAEGITFTRRCRQGQVLFGKRRAYQRKVAVAEFDAVVSGDIYVLTPKDPARLLPDLLPFLCLSERFFQHAVGTSAGSLSPRTNWSSLASFEFDLPPLDQQRRLAEILWALDTLLAKSIQLMDATVVAKQALQENLLRSDDSNTLGTLTALRDLTQRISVGLATSTTESYRESGVVLIRNQNIRPLRLDDRELLFLEPNFANQFENKKLKARDIITTRTGANIGQTCMVPEGYAGAHSFTTLIVTCDETKLLPEYLVQHMNAPAGVREVERLGTAGGKGNLNVAALALYRIALPSLEEQRIAARKLSAFDEAKESVSTNCDGLRTLSQQLIQTLIS